MFIIIMIDYTHIFLSFKRGDVRLLYKYMYRGLITYAVKILGDENAYVAEDCVQDAVMKAYENADMFESALHWRSYILTCLRNNCLMIHRRKTASANYLSDNQGDEYETDMMAERIRQETLDTLFAAIDSLPDIYREIFTLSFEQGLKNKEIARLLNIAEGTVKKRKANLISRLRASMGLTEEELIVLLALAATAARA